MNKKSTIVIPQGVPLFCFFFVLLLKTHFTGTSLSTQKIKKSLPHASPFFLLVLFLSLPFSHSHLLSSSLSLSLKTYFFLFLLFLCSNNSPLSPTFSLNPLLGFPSLLVPSSNQFSATPYSISLSHLFIFSSFHLNPLPLLFFLSLNLNSLHQKPLPLPPDFLGLPLLFIFFKS